MCARTLADKLNSEEEDGRGAKNISRIPPIAISHRINKHNQKTTQPTKDAIAVMTAYTKSLSDIIYLGAHHFQKSKFYIVLTRTTQPAHAVLFFAVLCSAWCLALPSDSQPSSPAAALLYLGCFAAHFGAQLWMTFVSGLSLYFSLPRHHFGEVQRVLFPRYFALNAALSLGTLIGFARQHPAAVWDPALALQAATLAACFLSELAVRLYLTGPLVSLIGAKQAIEERAGVGSEIGHQEMGGLVHCPHYTRLHQTFRRVHSIIAVANMACLGASALHLHFLAQKLATLT